MSTLSAIENEGYSRVGERLLAGGNRRFPSRLDFNRTDVVEFRLQAAEHLSISGIQDKISLKLVRGKLVPSEADGEYILKPVPSADIPRFKSDVPANEHLTMQIAAQIFGITTAANAVIPFADGELAYITRRFDRQDGTKIAQEDFCQLSNRSEQTSGRNYKYDGTYEETGRILQRYCKAYPVEIEKLFARIVFNYVFSNGDAHLKNFSLYRSGFGDHVLTPAYDLICTSLHFSNESRTALDLFDKLETDSFHQNAFYKRPDFMKLAELFGMNLERAIRTLDRLTSKRDEVLHLVIQSYLSDQAKGDYRARYDDRLRAMSG